MPDFLMIGAQKAGTTSICDELRMVEGVWMCPEKEPEDLAREDVLGPAGRAAYARKFRRAPADALVGEASTAYAMRPLHAGTAERARALLPAHARLIYVLRDPADRAISQYQHEWALGIERRGLLEAIVEDERYSALSRYGYQIEPWERSFESDHVGVFSFERYRHDRAGFLQALLAFLGVDAAPAAVAPGARNRSLGKRPPRQGSLLRRAVTSQGYHQFLKPFVPRVVRAAGKRVLVRPPPPPTMEDEAAARAFVRERVAADPLSTRATRWALEWSTASTRSSDRSSSKTMEGEE